MRWKTSEKALAAISPGPLIILLMALLVCAAIIALPATAANSTQTTSPTQTTVPSTTTSATTTSATTSVPSTTQTTLPATTATTTTVSTTHTTVPATTQTTTVVTTATQSQANPVVAFFADPTEGPAPLEVQFTDMSLGGPTSWNWDFGDGTSDNVKNPSHTYQEEGTYTIRLTATTHTGSSSATRSDYIVVAAAPTTTSTATTTTTAATTATTTSSSGLLAAFTGSPRSGNAPLTVVFTDTTTGTPIAWLWDFGDGATDTTQNPVHAYKKVGTYTVTMTVNSSGGGKTVKQVDFITVNSPFDTVGSGGASGGSTGSGLQVSTQAASTMSPGAGSGQSNVGKTKTPTPTLTGKAWLDYEKQRMAEVDSLAANQTNKDIISQIFDFFKGLFPFLK